MVIRVLGATLALAVVLTGCTSKEKAPTVLPPVPSASPSLAPLSPPPEAAAETSEGASAFARYYMEALDRAYNTGEDAEVEELSAPGCGGCDSLITVIKELRSDGQRSVGGEYQVVTVLAPMVVNGDVTVDLTYTRPPGQIIDTENRVVESSAPVPLTRAQMRLIRVEGEWLVRGFRVLGRA